MTTPSLRLFLDIAGLTDAGLPDPDECDEKLRASLLALMDSGTICYEDWNGPCGWDDRPDESHLCMKDRGHEGRHVCPCGVTR